jgi:hypothetical protein
MKNSPKSMDMVQKIVTNKSSKIFYTTMMQQKTTTSCVSTCLVQWAIDNEERK